MKLGRRALAMALACLMLLAFAPSAWADTGVKSKSGDFAAQAGGNTYLVLSVDSGVVLYMVSGSTLVTVDIATQIDDLMAVDGTLYYLRNADNAFQVISRASEGTMSTLATFSSPSVYMLTYYDGSLYCLVDYKLTRIDLATSTISTVSEREMTEFVIADSLVYYVSRTDTTSYTHESTLGGSATSFTQNAGMLYTMRLDGTSDTQLLNQGANSLFAHGDYLYFHNLNDAYVMTNNQEEWLEGNLYRMNVQTNQLMVVANDYDWDYAVTDSGLMIYRSGEILLGELTGLNMSKLYTPEAYTSIALADAGLLVYENTLKKLTYVPFDRSAPYALYEEVNDVEPVATPLPSTTDDTLLPTTENTPEPEAANAPLTTSSNNNTTSSSSSSSGRLSIGSTGSAVKTLQSRLAKLGYPVGSADGTYGQKTYDAVRYFQNAIGWTETGTASTDLQAKINSSSAPEYVKYVALSKGSKGIRVEKLQEKLNELGYSVGKVDGIYGSGTVQAVKDFQSDNALTVDGKAGTATLKAVFGATSSGTYTELSRGDSGAKVKKLQTRLQELGYFTGNIGGNYLDLTTAAVKEFQDAIGWSQTGVATVALQEKLHASSAPCYGGYTKLSRGNSGTKVKNLQQRLKDLGYFTGNVAGNYKDLTTAAVKAFQKKLGWSQTGVATPLLQRRLFASDAPKASGSSGGTTSKYTKLSPGDTGEKVKTLQRRLRALGYFGGSIGGNYLEQTTAAVKEFQAKIGAEENGIASVSLQEKLFADDAPYADD